jgi:branched-chain amino acid transport system ATP-binding protein
MLEASDLMVFYENMLALNNQHIRCDQNQIVGSSAPTVPANQR